MSSDLKRLLFVRMQVIKAGLFFKRHAHPQICESNQYILRLLYKLLANSLFHSLSPMKLHRLLLVIVIFHYNFNRCSLIFLACPILNRFLFFFPAFISTSKGPPESPWQVSILFPPAQIILSVVYFNSR